MVWTSSACLSLKSRGQQLTKNGKKENCKHYSLLFRGYKHWQLKGEVSSLKCSLLIQYIPLLLLRATRPNISRFHSRKMTNFVQVQNANRRIWRPYSCVKSSVGRRDKRESMSHSSDDIGKKRGGGRFVGCQSVSQSSLTIFILTASRFSLVSKIPMCASPKISLSVPFIFCSSTSLKRNSSMCIDKVYLIHGMFMLKILDSKDTESY